MSKTARMIRQLTDSWSGDARLYELSEAVSYTFWGDGYQEEEHETNYVIVSAIENAIGHETFIFPANEGGEFLDMLELDGSYAGGTDHALALEGAGFTVVEEE